MMWWDDLFIFLRKTLFFGNRQVGLGIAFIDGEEAGWLIVEGRRIRPSWAEQNAEVTGKIGEGEMEWDELACLLAWLSIGLRYSSLGILSTYIPIYMTEGGEFIMHDGDYTRFAYVAYQPLSFLSLSFHSMHELRENRMAPAEPNTSHPIQNLKIIKTLDAASQKPRV